MKRTSKINKQFSVAIHTGSSHPVIAKILCTCTFPIIMHAERLTAGRFFLSRFVQQFRESKIQRLSFEEKPDMRNSNATNADTQLVKTNDDVQKKKTALDGRLQRKNLGVFDHQVHQKLGTDIIRVSFDAQ